MLGFYLMMLDTPEEQSRMAQIWEKYRKYFLNIARKYLADSQTVEDAVSETFTKIIENKDKLFELEEVQFRKYSTTICVNVCLMVLRGNKKVRSLEEMPNEISDKEDLVVTFENREQTTILRECLTELGEFDNTVLELHCLQGYTLKNVAEKTGMSLSAVKNSLVRARGKLKKLLIERQAVC